jgi:hypothetical protein
MKIVRISLYAAALVVDEDVDRSCQPRPEKVLGLLDADRGELAEPTRLRLRGPVPVNGRLAQLRRLPVEARPVVLVAEGALVGDRHGSIVVDRPPVVGHEGVRRHVVGSGVPRVACPVRATGHRRHDRAVGPGHLEKQLEPIGRSARVGDVEAHLLAVLRVGVLRAEAVEGCCRGGEQDRQRHRRDATREDARQPSHDTRPKSRRPTVRLPSPRSPSATSHHVSP